MELYLLIYDTHAYIIEKYVVHKVIEKFIRYYKTHVSLFHLGIYHEGKWLNDLSSVTVRKEVRWSWIIWG